MAEVLRGVRGLFARGDAEDAGSAVVVFCSRAGSPDLLFRRIGNQTHHLRTSKFGASIRSTLGRQNWNQHLTALSDSVCLSTYDSFSSKFQLFRIWLARRLVAFFRIYGTEPRSDSRRSAGASRSSQRWLGQRRGRRARPAPRSACAGSRTSSRSRRSGSTGSIPADS